MKVKRLILDSEYYAEKAGELQDKVSLPERKSWVEHSCTQVLIGMIQGRIASSIEQWTSGAISAEGIEASAQLNAKVIGQIQVLEDMLEEIVAIGTYDFDGEQQ